MKLLLPLFLIAQLTLHGQVSKEQGRIGVRHSTWGRVNHVYVHSPAHTAGIKPGDIIKAVDDVEGCQGIRGPAGSVVKIRVRRLRDDLVFQMQRAGEADVWD